MKHWILKIAVLLAVPLLAAVVDSQVRPVPPKQKQPATESTVMSNQTDPSASSEAVDDQSIEFFKNHFEQGTALFIDARPRDQFEESHIPNSFHLPFKAFFQGRPSVLDFLPEGELLIIYCEGGDCDASHKVKEMLTDFGYQNLHVMEEGFPAWIEAGLPTESGPPLVE